MTTSITEIRFPQTDGQYPSGCIVNRDGGAASVASLAGNGMTWHAPRKNHGEVRYISLPEPAEESCMIPSPLPTAEMSGGGTPVLSNREGAHS
jgi:hypothetical protein